MDVIVMPAIKLIEGRPFEGRWRLRDKVLGPVDFTRPIGGKPWSARFRLARALEGPALIERIPTLTAAGEIIVAFPASAFASLCPPPVIGGGAVAMFQIEINAPLSEMDQIWQGPAILAGVI